MKIKELYIRKFGKLKDYKLVLSDGMNVLFGNNEAGKTTIFNFILAMLYGFSNTRGKGISDSARKKYMTWGENKIGGTMTVEYNGIVYVIDRSFGKTRAGDSLEFKNLTLGESVDLPNGREIGEYLFDLDEKSFKGTCFISQLSKDDVCDNDSVRTKLSNLSSVGDVEYSFDDVFNRLKNASLEITRKTSTGKKYPLENKVSELESRNRVIENELSHIASIDDENKELENKLTALSSNLSETDASINKANSQRKALEYKKALENNKNIEVAYAEYQNSANAITRKGFTADREYVDELNSLIKKRDDARLKYEYEERVLENEKKTFELIATSNVKKKSKAVVPIVIVGLLLLIAAVLIYAFLNSMGASFIVMAVGVVSIVCALVFNSKAKQKNNELQTELVAKKAKLDENVEKVNNLKEMYIICDNEFKKQYLLVFEQNEIDIAYKKINTLSTLLDKYVESKIRYDAIKSSAVSQETLEQMRKNMDAADLTTELVNVDVSELEARRAFIANESLTIEKTLLVNKERAKGRGKLQTELDNNLSEISEINEKIKAFDYSKECIDLAKQGLENAQKEMQKQFAPDVSCLVSEILSEITCGKYEKMTLNSNLETMVIDSESGAAMEDGYMSTGTLDQIYLALRFAMIKLIFDSKEYPIICMDDALLSFDYSRMKKATEYINDVLSKDAQVLFFTCRDTERDCFSASNLISV